MPRRPIPENDRRPIGRPRKVVPYDPAIRASLDEASRLYRAAKRQEKEARLNGNLSLALDYAKEARLAHDQVARIRGDFVSKQTHFQGVSIEEAQRIVSVAVASKVASDHEVANVCLTYLMQYNKAYPERAKEIAVSGRPKRFDALPEGDG